MLDLEISTGADWRQFREREFDFNSQLPGGRHCKLLIRLVLDQWEYIQIDRHLQQVWKEG